MARVHPIVQANYLASPPLVVAYAIAGNVKLDLEKEPLGINPATKAEANITDGFDVFVQLVIAAMTTSP